MTHRNRFSDEEDGIIRRLWSSTEVADIARHLGRQTVSIYQRAKLLGLPSRGLGPSESRPCLTSTQQQFKITGARRMASLKHRRSLGFSDPIILTPSASLFGFPLRAIDPETRALIDRAIETRAGA